MRQLFILRAHSPCLVTPSVWKSIIICTLPDNTRYTNPPKNNFTNVKKNGDKKTYFSPIELPRSWDRIHHFRVPKTLIFIIRPSAKPFIWKWVLFKWKNKIIFFYNIKNFAVKLVLKERLSVDPQWIAHCLWEKPFSFFFLSQMKKLFASVIWLKNLSLKASIFKSVNFWHH